MSKINQIQNALRELDGGAFQKLADAYLFKKGYERLNPLGSVIGANKVRPGTPDTLISLPNGKYVFAEYTTQRQDVFEKFVSDLKKCFDETKTGVPLAKIEEVVLCHTSLLESEEEEALAALCHSHGINLGIFGIGPLSNDLYQKYPGIARDFLGIEVDTGQIVSVEEFLTSYNKNKLATRLDTKFHFREEEISEALRSLESGNLVLLSGPAGIGKSRLAVECCRQFQVTHPNYQVLCIFHRGPDLFTDLRIHFSAPGHYLILVDDANRISQFDYVVQLLMDQRNDQSIKVIATVRDYALNAVREVAERFAPPVEIALQCFDDEKIKKLVEDEYGIRHHLYLDRITEIAKGNPRLAVMAAELANKENGLHSLSNAEELYEHYFASIRRDIEALSNPNVLRAAGIVAFFRAVDGSNEPMMRKITQGFNISGEAFWNAVERLHALEAVDLHRTDVVRTADQALTTYLFYLAFFKERVLDFSILLDRFFPAFRPRFIDALNPVLTIFDGKAICDVLRQPVKEIWEKRQKAGDEKGILGLLDLFGFVAPTDTLLYIQEKIEEMPTEAAVLSPLTLRASSDFPTPSILSVLRSFRHHDKVTFEIALDLVFAYLSKKPQELPRVVRLFTEFFGFTHESYAIHYAVQQVVIDKLWQHTENGANGLLSRLFLAVAADYLKTHFHRSYSKGYTAITVFDFALSPSPALEALRQTIWNRLFQLYDIPTFSEQVLALLQAHKPHGSEEEIAKIVEQDAACVLPFIQSSLSPDNFRHCLLVQDHLDQLDFRNVPFKKALREKFKNETYAVYDLLCSNWLKHRNRELNHEEFCTHKRERIRRRFAKATLPEYKELIGHCIEIERACEKKYCQCHLSPEMNRIFHDVAVRDADSYIDVFYYYLECGDPFALVPDSHIELLIRFKGAAGALETLTRSDHPRKHRWLFGFYRNLPAEDVSAERLSQLYSLYQEAKPEDLPYSFDLLQKYRHLDPHVMTRVVRIIVEKAERGENYTIALQEVFSHPLQTSEELMALFGEDLKILKRAYLLGFAADSSSDHDGAIFSRLLDIDHEFLQEFIDQTYEESHDLGWYTHTRNFSFLWLHPQYELLLEGAIERIFEHNSKGLHGIGVKDLLIREAESEHHSEIIRRQDQALARLIERRQNEFDFVQFLFDAICEACSPDRRRSFLASFLSVNKRFEDFERLSIELQSRSTSGSWVPVYQARMDYLESLLPLLNSAVLLRHKRYIETEIEGWRSRIEHEKKKDFMQG